MQAESPKLTFIFLHSVYNLQHSVKSKGNLLVQLFVMHENKLSVVIAKNNNCENFDEILVNTVAR